MEWMLADALGLRGNGTPEVAPVYRIFVRDLVLPCSIGIHPHERQARQRVRFNVELLVATPPPRSDDFAEALNYETIVAGAKRLAEAGHVDLVETLADRIAALCFHDVRVREVRVTVEKLEVYPEAESVGVTIEYRRPPPGERA
jgi:dihydroneopterin aldolase